MDLYHRSKLEMEISLLRPRSNALDGADGFCWESAFGAFGNRSFCEVSSAHTPPEYLSLKTYEACAVDAFVTGKNDPVTSDAFGRKPSAVSSFAPTPSALAPSSKGFAFGIRKVFDSRILLRWKDAQSAEEEKTKELAEVRTFAASAFGVASAEEFQEARISGEIERPGTCKKMARSTQLRMVPLKVPQIDLRTFQNELSAVKLNFLLWGWNWVCPEMVREWLRERNQLYLREAEVDTDPDEAPASPAPAPARAEEEHRSERAPRKRKWDERPEDRQPEAPAANRIDPATIVRAPSADTPPAKTPSAQIAPEEQAVEVGGAGATRVTAAPTPSRTGDQAGAEAQAVGSPTALDILAGSGAAVAAEAATHHSSRESPRASVATEILETEDETSSEEQEADSVHGTPTGVPSVGDEE
ncbi:hypothetical protein AXG93_1873s1010 [Marchantia polymorpha subsp. ruderalis]|uniref:Uncharacterized protein n=1 Tax=Marchantia polymorpha subsp. ruderalis TaxID=1480154 RepID=A0A176WMM3_MARPO|nr:hypothetical protein AXG93_1873s1010 [Marchantia polymorpha subsp. ruderalis]